MRIPGWLVLAAMVPLVFQGLLLAAEEEKSEKEKRREAEAAAEERLHNEDSQRAPLMRGKVVLFGTENAEEPNVIGLFECEKRRFRLEVEKEELKQEIRKYSNRELALRGKIRDQGTTFIVEAIEWGGPPPGLIRNPEGL